MTTLNKSKSKSSDQEFSKELAQKTFGQDTHGLSYGQNTVGQNSPGTPQTGKGNDITIPTGIEPGE